MDQTPPLMTHRLGLPKFKVTNIPLNTGYIGPLDHEKGVPTQDRNLHPNWEPRK